MSSRPAWSTLEFQNSQGYVSKHPPLAAVAAAAAIKGMPVQKARLCPSTAVSLRKTPQKPHQLDGEARPAFAYTQSQ